MDRKLNIAIISENRDLKQDLQTSIGSVLHFAGIYSFSLEKGFLESAEDLQPEIVICDRNDGDGGWKEFHHDLKKMLPGTLLIMAIPEAWKPEAPAMIKAGIYDVIYHSAVGSLESTLHRAVRYIDERLMMRRLSKEKDFSDHITNSSRSMLSIINRDYIYEKVNATFCDAHKLAFDSIVGKSLSEVWGEETFRSSIKNNIDLCFGGNTVRYEASFDTPSLGKRFYEVIFRPIRLGSGEITHLLAETFDITELKISQRAVTEMEEEFKKLETNLPIGFLRCESDGTIIHANKALLKIIGCEEESLTGLNIRDFYSQNGLFDIHLRQLANEQVKTFGRVPMLTCRGSEIACRISGFVVKGDNGKPSFIDFAFEDSSRELMLENRLLQAQKLETIGALAGGLAHDFNNILLTIYGYSEMLLEEIPANSDAAEKVSRIISAVTRARSLTSQILTFSRQVEQHKIQVEVGEVLREATGFVNSGKPGNIQLITRIEDKDAQVFADPTQLFRVFLNLMTNSFQAMEDNGGTLSVDLFRVQGSCARYELNRDIIADEYVLIRFEDTGSGMDPSVMQRIFEPYFTTREVGKGTGLGLSVVHGIVAEMEGEILVSSVKGEGSVFTLYIPVSREDREGQLPKEKGKKLLFISGNIHESRVLSIGLEKCGYELDFARNRLSLLEKLAARIHATDMIIFMDDSEEITAEDLKAIYQENRTDVPLILITDLNQYASKELLLNSGIAKQVLIKPVSLREIENAIQLSIV